MEVLFLGTGAGIPGKLRNVTSIALKFLEEKGTVWLFDCGEATQHQILHTTLKPRRVEKIFITHLHGDHIFGLPGFLSSRSFQGGTTPVVIYGPKGLKEFVQLSLAVSETNVTYPLHFVEIEEGVIFEDDQFVVTARLLDHGIPSYGYRIVEKDRPGPLLVDKLKEMGIRPGPVYKKLKEGETVELEDGRTIDGKQFTGPGIKGRIVAILGDTRICQAAMDLSANADLLIHEATFAEGEEELARKYYHSTTVQAARTALEAKAKKLLLTHISSRYERDVWPKLEEEARKIFPNSEIAVDFKKVALPLQK